MLFLSVFCMNSWAKPQKKDIVIVLNNSSDMKSVFDNIVSVVEKNIFNEFSADDDSIHLIVFSTKTRLVYSAHNISKSLIRWQFNRQLKQVNASGIYSDYGRAIDFLNSFIKRRTHNPQKYIFFISSSKNDPSPESKYFDNITELNKQTKILEKHITSSKIKFYAFGNDEHSDIAEITKSINGNFVIISDFSSDAFANKINRLSYNLHNYVDLRYPRRLGKFNKNIKLTLRLESHYKEPVKIKFSTIKLKNISQRRLFGRDKIIIKNSANILVYATDVALKSNTATNITLDIASPNLANSRYRATVIIETDNANLLPNSFKIVFRRGGSNWYWVLAGLLLLFFLKSYIIGFFSRLHAKYSHQVLRKPSSFIGRTQLWIANLSDKPSILYKISAFLWDGADTLARLFVKSIVVSTKAIAFFIKATVIIIAKGFSYIVLIPFGFLFSKTGKAMLWLKDKIAKLKFKNDTSKKK